MKLFNLGSFFDSLDPLKIDTTRCLQTISPLTGCNRCFDVCPTHGLFFADDGIKYNNCTHCGACVKVCPQNVFTLDFPRLAESETSPLIITCEKILPNESAIIHTHCLDQFTPEMLFSLAQNRPVIIYADETCQSCTNSFFLQSLPLMCKQYPFSLNCQFINHPTELAPYLQNKTSPIDRRGFFEQALHRGKKSTAQATEKVLSKGETLLNDTLDFLSETQEIYTPQKITSPRYALLPLSADDPQKTLPYRQLTVDSCSFCNACTHLCPTTALRLQKDEQCAAILYSPYLCNGCNLCADVCPEHGIRWNDFLTAQNFRTNHIVASSPTYQCKKCQNDYWQYPPNDDSLCRFCRK